MATEFMFNPETDSVEVLNDTGVPNEAVFSALNDQNPEVAALVRWSSEMKMTPSRRGSMFDRDRYVSPEAPREQMKVAYWASETDDVVSGVIESTEALAFSKMSVDTEDEDQTDVWNQIAENLDMDRRLREMWREDFTISQFICAVWWGNRSFKVRGRSDKGVQRKKKFDNMTVPLGVTMLDPLKVVPVGNLLFNQEMLAYQADSGYEHDLFQAVINGDKEDETIRQLMIGPYTPDPSEARMLAEDGIQTHRLFLLNPNNVFRHADTKSQYQRYAPLRMRSIFELLDLKTQLRAMDRAHLLGGTNFIVLVKKGDKDRPAKAGEIAGLQQQVRRLARVPVIVGDDRLNIEIITPDNDRTLEPERYNGLDARITARLFQMFMTGNFAAGAKGDDSVKLAKIVARGLESRRHMIRRTVEKHILFPTFDINEQFTDRPKLRFHPKRIALDFDPTYATYLLDLFDRGPLSMESLLEEIDYDLVVEHRRRKVEAEKYEEVLQPRAAPGASNLGAGGADPKSAGRQLGGVKGGGGAAPGSGQGEPAKNPAKKSGPSGSTRK